ncbi:hypothetical protein O3P69_017531 [Scylla paramamosain]|uniref:Uncharacterized protein n=1 Tax=Scylla paramamosain TaxID=85552 RepID=A0AAW0TW67_SCYPA
MKTRDEALLDLLQLWSVPSLLQPLPANLSCIKPFPAISSDLQPSPASLSHFQPPPAISKSLEAVLATVVQPTATIHPYIPWCVGGGAQSSHAGSHFLAV